MAITNRSSSPTTGSSREGSASPDGEGLFRNNVTVTTLVSHKPLRPFVFFSPRRAETILPQLISKKNCLPPSKRSGPKPFFTGLVVLGFSAQAYGASFSEIIPCLGVKVPGRSLGMLLLRVLLACALDEDPCGPRKPNSPSFKRLLECSSQNNRSMSWIGFHKHGCPHPRNMDSHGPSLQQLRCWASRKEAGTKEFSIVTFLLH